MHHHTYSFEKLDVWKCARIFKKRIYVITENFPNEEKFGYTSQLRRSASSITVNLAEGSGRASNTDKAHFTNMAYTSALEVIDHLISALDLDFIAESDYISLRIDADEIINKLNALYRFQMKEEQSLKSKMQNGSI